MKYLLLILIFASACGHSHVESLTAPTPTPIPTPVPTFQVTPSGANITTAPSTAQTVTQGATQVFAVTATGGYLLSTAVSGTCPLGIWSGGNYTTGAITADCTVIFSSQQVKRIFVTAAMSTGNLGGITGADSLCSVDTNKPAGGGTYKALLTDGSTRVACTTAGCAGGVSESTHWVLAANTTYVRVDESTVIGTTTIAGIFSFPVTSSVVAGVSIYTWTGLASDWTSSSDNCSGWTSGVSATAAGGDASQVTDSLIWINTLNCSSTNVHLYCVEQ